MLELFWSKLVSSALSQMKYTCTWWIESETYTYYFERLSAFLKVLSLTKGAKMKKKSSVFFLFNFERVY